MLYKIQFKQPKFGVKTRLKQRNINRLPLDAYGIDSSRRRLFADFSDDEGIVEEPAVSAASRFPNYGARSRDHPDERVPEFLAALYLILARFFAWVSREEAFQSHNILAILKLSIET